MSVPSRAQAAAIVRDFEPPKKLVRHSAAVAEIAAFLASAMDRRGVAVDTALVESAALLHDIDKMLPAGDPLRDLGHAAAGAEWLRRNGHPELATAVASHPVMILAEAPSYAAWAGSAGLTGQIVGYADKRALQDLVSLDERFARWHRRYPDSPPLDVAQRRAEHLEQELCALAGVDPSGVMRLAWVEEAIDGAI